MAEIKLLPCPFCGGEAKLHKDGFGCGHRVYCGKCFIRTECYESKETPIEKWNTRKPMERIVEQLEEELRLADIEKERCARENVLQFDSAKGYSHAMSHAIEIVKDGGSDET